MYLMCLGKYNAALDFEPLIIILPCGDRDGDPITGSVIKIISLDKCSLTCSSAQAILDFIVFIWRHLVLVCLPVVRLCPESPGCPAWSGWVPLSS